MSFLDERLLVNREAQMPQRNAAYNYKRSFNSGFLSFLCQEKFIGKSVFVNLLFAQEN